MEAGVTLHCFFGPGLAGDGCPRFCLLPHEVVGPDLVRSRERLRLGPGRSPPAGALARDLQARCAPEPVRPPRAPAPAAVNAPCAISLREVKSWLPRCHDASRRARPSCRADTSLRRSAPNPPVRRQALSEEEPQCAGTLHGGSDRHPAPLSVHSLLRPREVSRSAAARSAHPRTYQSCTVV